MKVLAIAAGLALGGLGAGQGLAASPQPGGKPRVVVTTDPELDDNNSLLRYLLYSTDFETEGLIYASAPWHWKGDGKGTLFLNPEGEYRKHGLALCPCTSWRWGPNERFIDDIVEDYEKAYPNLKIHDPEYPTPADLKARIRWGNVEFDGDITKDTDGSNLIKSILLDDSPGPVYLLAWGGGSTIARALKSIKDQYESTPAWPQIRDKVSKKAVIQAWGDQDKTIGTYVQPNWPGIEFREMATTTYGYGARSAVLPADQIYLSPAWTRENISSRGPMGEQYRVWQDGKHMAPGDIYDPFGEVGLTVEQLKAKGYVFFSDEIKIEEKGAFISEGDTSTFMNLLDNGLRGYEHASYGGWGGRSGIDIGPSGPSKDYASARFFGPVQRDLAARLKWAVTPRYRDANHPPAVTVGGLLDRMVHAGEIVRLAGSVRDPDGDAVTTRWWQYAEAGTYAGKLVIAEPAAKAVQVRVPADARPGDTIHLIFEATDQGEPQLTRYARVILKVQR